jgi:hypothetical protein
MLEFVATARASQDEPTKRPACCRYASRRLQARYEYRNDHIAVIIDELGKATAIFLLRAG